MQCLTYWLMFPFVCFLAFSFSLASQLSGMRIRIMVVFFSGVNVLRSVLHLGVLPLRSLDMLVCVEYAVVARNHFSKMLYRWTHGFNDFFSGPAWLCPVFAWDRYVKLYGDLHSVFVGFGLSPPFSVSTCHVYCRASFVVLLFL